MVKTTKDFSHALPGFKGTVSNVSSVSWTLFLLLSVHVYISTKRQQTAMRSCLFWGRRSWVYLDAAVSVQDGGRLYPMGLSTGPLASWVEPLPSPCLLSSVGRLCRWRERVSLSGERLRGQSLFLSEWISVSFECGCLFQEQGKLPGWRFLAWVIAAFSCLLSWIFNSRPDCRDLGTEAIPWFLQDGVKPQRQWFWFPSHISLFLPSRGVLGSLHHSLWRERTLPQAGDCSDQWLMQQCYGMFSRAW